MRVEILVLRGEAHLELSELDKADKAFREAAELEPGHAPALVGQALVHLRRGDQDNAKRFVSQALEIDKNDAQAWYIKGELSRLTADLPTAIAAYDTAIALAPEHLPARYSRAAVYIDLDELEAAGVDSQLRSRAIRARPPSSLYACDKRSRVRPRVTDQPTRCTRPRLH